jgi:hypothetical protein
MTAKMIVVMANSVKKSGRCLAGREIILSGKEWSVGNWIRPVTSQDGDEVSVYTLRQALGREPQLLEIIEIPLDAPAPQPDQPENWIISRTGVRKSHGNVKFDDLHRLLDHPDNLWGSHMRYVEAGFPQRMAQPASLYPIQPEQIEPLRVWTEGTVDGQGRPYDRHRRRVSLRYHGLFHELDITDPQLQDRYYPKLPAKHKASLTIALRDPRHTAVCVSLTPVWQGRHYKLAAAFIEPPVTAGT